MTHSTWRIGTEAGGSFPRFDFNGILGNRGKTKFASILDGTSNTIAFAEVANSPNVTAGTGQGWAWVWDGLLTDARLTPNAPGTWPGDMTWTNPRETANAQTASSFHQGGIHVALGDASVRFIAQNIALTTYQAMVTRAGGEVTSE